MIQRILLSCFLINCCVWWADAQSIRVPADTAVSTEHKSTINGKLIEYSATAGTQPVWNGKGEKIATVQYTYYRKKGGDLKKRPIVFSFNGGPGSASAWMHLGYTGPKLLRLDEEGFPIQPYGIEDNPHSILDVADLVYVNPVNTGYSRIIPDENGKENRNAFFGINEDIRYLASWINHFISRNNRWLSPKFLIGESYGGTRVSGLAHELQTKHWIYLNGVILVSPADYKVFESDYPISYGLNIPYFTATAHYHNRLPADLQSLSLEEVLKQSESETINYFIPKLIQVGNLPDEKKEEYANKLERFTGIPSSDILDQNLLLSTSYFWKDLLRDTLGLTVGRLDSRYRGLDKMQSGNRPDFNVELTSWSHAFQPAINYYLREELGFNLEAQYKLFGNVHPWNRKGNNVRENLRKAMAQNPYLQVLVQAGYYDGGTTYFNSKYTLWQLDPSGKLSNRLHFKGYESGHMMYVRKPDLKTANSDLRTFIKNSLTDGKPAKY
jgi:carboxypeptidase C (cathepsin A)